jgi:hypothetical protein
MELMTDMLLARRPLKLPLSPLGTGWRAQRAGKKASIEGLYNQFEYCACIFQNVVVPKSHHNKAARLWPCIALLVSYISRMLPAVNLNDEFPIEAIKVDHISSDRHLALKFVASEAMRAKVIPEPPFGVAHFAPQ